MKTSQSINLGSIRFLGVAITVALLTSLAGCNDDDPQKEDTPELITKITLTFTPDAGAPVMATATDPDGEGVQDLTVDGPINLQSNTSYTLDIALLNELAQPSDPAHNISEEVKEEGDEHMLFFGWTNDMFSDPAGNGNIDSRSGAVNYEDQDANSLPLGLETRWETAGMSSGTFRVVLKHQPGLKSETSSSSIGETDLDVTFNINIQ